MVNYQLGKIYKIVNDINDKFYIGSTAQRYLSSRMATHKKKHTTCMSRNIGINLKECSIILIENYPCKDKQELLKREREYFDKHKKENNDIFVNKHRPIVTKEEKEIRKKEYEKNNKDKFNNLKKIWRENNPTYHKQKNIIFYEKNKELSKEKSKKRYENNKEKILERLKEKITCDCGSLISRSSLYRHKKSKKHIKYIESLQ
tara:strand:- start:373 stop:981 length:609 start_codon:yes stop_codon:yes gene_type:complete